MAEQHTHAHTYVCIGKLQISYETYLATPHMFMCVHVDCAF